MSLTIEPVTAATRAAAEQLQVLPNQLGFIESVTECMEEADEYNQWNPVTILHDGTPVGFSMYGYFQENSKNKLWFDRLLIDGRYQHHGYGREAIHVILTEMRRQYPQEDIYLSVYDNNPVAIALYESCGFHFNGELDYNGEKVMVLTAEQPLP